MRFLIQSLNYAPEPTGIGLYSGGLAQSLSERGHDVAVVCAVPHFPQWKIFDNFRQKWSSGLENGVHVTRCPIFIPNEMSAAKRIVHYVSFFLSALLPAIWQARKHKADLVICVAPSLIAAPAGLIAAKLAGARTQLHIQDFEVEAAFATDYMSAAGPVSKFAGWFERKVLKAFDHVSTISPEMANKLQSKGVPLDRIFLLRNWAEISHIVPQDNSTYRAKWNVGDRHVALYSGSIAEKQGIESIIDAARLLKDRSDILFVICGNGPRRPYVEGLARDLPNVQVYDLQPFEDLGELLNLASLHLLPQRKEAADLVLPSKLANMLASGRPVVAGVEDGTGIAREIEGAGLACEPESGSAMAASVVALIDQPDMRRSLGETARSRAIERWSRDKIIARFVEDIQIAGT